MEIFYSPAEVEQLLEYFVQLIDQKGGKVSTVQFFVTDQEGEFTSNEFHKLLTKRGISHTVALANTPKCFAFVERANGTLGK